MKGFRVRAYLAGATTLTTAALAIYAFAAPRNQPF